MALNESSRYLWEQLRGREFDLDDVVSLLVERYEVDEATARRDAEAWMSRLAECGVLEQ